MLACNTDLPEEQAMVVSTQQAMLKHMENAPLAITSFKVVPIIVPNELAY